MLMMTRWFAVFTIIFVLVGSITASGEEKSVPLLKSSVDPNYRKTYIYYHRIYSTEKKQVRD